MSLPGITITFRERAKTAFIRSRRGAVGLILVESSLPTTNPMTITSVAEIPGTLSSFNRKQIELALMGYLEGARKVVCFFVLPTHDEATYTAVQNPKKKDNPSTKGWYTVSDGTYSGTTDTAPASGATYYAIAEVTPAGSENPSTSGWLERSGTEGAYTYAATSDETVGSKTYYTATAVTPEQGDNPSTKGWYEVSGTTYELSTDTEVNDADTYYTKESETVDTPDITDALSAAIQTDINYLAMPTAETYSLVADIVAWAKTIHADNKENNVIIPILPNANSADTEYVINYATASVTDGDGNTYTAEQYCARIAGLIATTPLNRSATYAPLPELADCTRLTRTEAGAANDAGKFVAFWDGEKVKLTRAVNSLTTTSEVKGSEYKKIKVIDTMMLIRGDIKRTAEDNYIGKYTNSYDNKVLLITAINDYFDSLVKQGALNSGYCEIDIDANRSYLMDQGVDVSTMTDEDIKVAVTGEKVFLKANIEILDAMEDITLAITI